MVQVDVFGIRDEAPAGSCSCGGACGSQSDKTMGEMFDELVRFLQVSDVAAGVQCKFIDVLEDDLRGYDTAHAMFKNGFSLPLVAVNGLVRFFGGLSNGMVYDEVRKLNQG